MNVLVAEDDPVSRLRVTAFLRKWGYDVTAVADGVAALDVLSQPDGPRLAILDRMMPNLDGLGVCRAIREAAREPYIYIILLTGQGDPDEVVEGLEAGADEYVVKPFEAQELRARIRTGLRLNELQDQLIAAREQLRVEAMYDSLTGLLNRAAFFKTFEREVARATREGTPLALVMADIDHFKAINDRHGHIAGDTVLTEAARRLRGCLRSSDVLGRFGGEEFVVLASGCNIENAAEMAERFRVRVSAEPIGFANTSLRLTMSLGVAGTSDMGRADGLLQAADAALYQAKQSGRNRIAVAPRLV